MRSLIAPLALLLFTANARAHSFHDQLRAFNPYWDHHRAALEGIEARAIRNDAHYVQVHLEQVLRVLAEATTDHLSHDQRDSRTALIAVLADYAHQGRFPINYHRPGRTPVFIDEHDTFCAVGHLMRCTGEEAMARRIAAMDNFAWVRDIHDPGLSGWQKSTGFSLDELKLIQGAYEFYIPDAFLLPDKYEVPQKPEHVVRYFDGQDREKVWCMGEGSNGELHGRWVQNYSSTLPWIEGYFEHGKRSGRWKEYYKGTDKLCRTEHWRDDKLNGIRTRYDREGQVIETILFKNGQAVTKTNIDHDKALRWVRSPIDSATVRTEIFTEEGALIAAGTERIHNPEGLLWFQNIELTALNTYAISARDGAPRPELGVMVSPFFPDGQEQQIPGSHALVQYRKEGEWRYYKDYLDLQADAFGPQNREGLFTLGYSHFGKELYANIASYDHLELTASYDSMHVVYTNDRMVDLFGFAPKAQDHLRFAYHLPDLSYLRFRGRFGREEQLPVPPVRRITRLDAQGDLIGTRVDYDQRGRVTREERFLVPYKREEDLLGVAQ